MSVIISDSLTVEPGPGVSDEVQQGLREDALLSKVLDEDVTLSFGEFAAVAVEQQRQVSVRRRTPAQRGEQLQVFGGGDQPLRATKHMTDTHVMVVHHAGQVVRGESVGLQDDWVALHRGHLVPGPAEHQVLEGLGAGIQSEADHVRDAERQLLLDPLRLQVPTPVIIAETQRHVPSHA